MVAQREKIRTALMDGTVKVIANSGFDKATTRAITTSVSDVKLNETYIYRYFLDKEDLFKKTFMRADHKFVEYISKNLRQIEELKENTKECCRRLWQSCWEFLLANREEYIFYLRYYYSVYFKEYALKEHMALYSTFLTDFARLVPNTTNVPAMMHTLLEFALSELAKADDVNMSKPQRESRNFDLVWNIILLHFSQERAG